MPLKLLIPTLVFLVTLVSVCALPKYKSDFKSERCSLRKDLVDEIASYKPAVEKIIQYVTEGEFKGKTYDELAKFVDTFGARPSGSDVLERSIDYMINLTKQHGIEDIQTESLEVPHFIRGEESLIMVEPREKKMEIIGLGRSISTPEKGIEAEVVVVSSFDELEKLSDGEVKDKIVLYNVPYITYGDTVPYRSRGASTAAKKGAIASLVKSIAPFSINSPHTGSQTYEDGVPKIPTAAITIEDAELISRIKSRGENVKLRLKMFSSTETATSRNTIIDYKGKESPEKLVILSGHIDSWDVGQGAMDDGGGIFVSWAAPIVLKNLHLETKRTVRTIFWTAEELGLIGVQAYEEKHRNESKNINFIMESDEGTFKPKGLAVGGTAEARCIVAEVLKLFASIEATELVEDDSPGSDISIIVATGVPGAGLLNENEKYFWFHHTEGDTMTVENPHELDLGTAFWTAVAYVIADLSIDIPRH